MMNKQTENKISKFLSYTLRHHPEDIGLTLDNNGWAIVEDLLEKAKKKGIHISFKDLKQIVANNDKQRFLFSSDEHKIKANQGHTIQVELGLHDTQPPEFLFHGTAKTSLASILKEGLKPMQRHDVHLSFNPEVAKSVGSRYGVPVILKIKSLEMFNDGLNFQCTPNNVWLTKHVDPKYIIVL